MNTIRVMIIDDERSAREELKRALQVYTDIDIIDEARHADEAKEKIDAQRPDLIFLDIQMPGQSGLDLLASLETVPAVIFVTAYNEYAVKAFEIDALDYLVKPVREERLAKAIEKIRNTISTQVVPGKEHTGDRSIFIKDGDRCYFTRLGNICLIESLDNYSRLYFEGKKAVLKRSLRQWEDMLDDTLFFRVNRTAIINIRHIERVNRLPGGRLQVQLKTGELLDVSSRQSVKFKNLNGL